MVEREEGRTSVLYPDSTSDSELGRDEKLFCEVGLLDFFQIRFCCLACSTDSKLEEPNKGSGWTGGRDVSVLLRGEIGRLGKMLDMDSIVADLPLVRGISESFIVGHMSQYIYNTSKLVTNEMTQKHNIEDQCCGLIDITSQRYKKNIVAIFI